MLNNIDTDSRLFQAFVNWIDNGGADGRFWGLDSDAVDTREPIDAFFKDRSVTIKADEIVDGIRLVHALTSSPAYPKSKIRELAMASDGEWTVVISG